MTSANLLGSLVFSAVGLFAFLRGKKEADGKSMIIGILLMVYSYFVPNTIWLYVGGAALTAALFLFHD